MSGNLATLVVRVFAGKLFDELTVIKILCMRLCLSLNLVVDSMCEIGMVQLN